MLLPRCSLALRKRRPLLLRAVLLLSLLLLRAVLLELLEPLVVRIGYLRDHIFLQRVPVLFAEQLSEPLEVAAGRRHLDFLGLAKPIAKLSLGLLEPLKHLIFLRLNPFVEFLLQLAELD